MVTALMIWTCTQCGISPRRSYKMLNYFLHSLCSTHETFLRDDVDYRMSLIALMP